MQLPIISRRGQVKPYGSLPRLNWGHPLAANLVVYGYDVGGFVFDLVEGGSGAHVDATAISRAQTAFGVGYSYTSVSGAIVLPTAGKFGAILGSSTSVAPWTIASGFFVTSVPAVAGTFSLADTGANNIMGAALASSTTVDFVNSNGVNDLDNIVVPNYLNQYNSIATVAPAASSNLGYFNGIQVASNALSNASSTGAISQPVFNTLQSNGLTNNGITGSVFWGGLWSRALTTTELLQLHFDPYCFLIYPEDEIFATLVGVVAGTSKLRRYSDLNGLGASGPFFHDPLAA